jgi:hypothetical protein
MNETKPGNDGDSDDKGGMVEEALRLGAELKAITPDNGQKEKVIVTVLPQGQTGSLPNSHDPKPS